MVHWLCWQVFPCWHVSHTRIILCQGAVVTHARLYLVRQWTKHIASICRTGSVLPSGLQLLVARPSPSLLTAWCHAGRTPEQALQPGPGFCCLPSLAGLSLTQDLHEAPLLAHPSLPAFTLTRLQPVSAWWTACCPAKLAAGRSLPRGPSARLCWQAAQKASLPRCACWGPA